MHMEILPDEYFTPINSYQGNGSVYFNPVAVAKLGKDDKSGKLPAKYLYP